MNVEYYLRRDYVANSVKEGKRLDGRGFEDVRPLEITKDYIEDKADGSAYVTLGKTKVVVGISLDIAEPYADSPESGVMMTTTELRPIASPDFELGPPRETSIEIARVVDRGIRESGIINMDKLFIEEGKVWMAFIDVHALDYDGNLIDAATLAGVTALLNTKLPKIEDGKIIRGEWDGKLPTTCTPIACTFAKVGDQLLLDPTLDEEYAMDSRLTVTTTDTVNAMQKGGVGSLTIEEVERAVDIAFKKGDELRKIVEKA